VLTTNDQACNALWLDPFSPAGDMERGRLAAAGLCLLPVRTLEDLRQALTKASAVVVRLMGNTDLLTEVRRLTEAFKQDIPIICRLDGKNLGLAVDAMRKGACHVLDADDYDENSWRSAVELATRAPAPPKPAAPVSRASARQESAPKPAPKTFVFADPMSQKLLALAQRVALAQVTTLVTGPTGAGKEVLAAVIHESSPRAGAPMVSLNCGAIPEHLMEDMLFGHEKGAYTGALRDHKGIFEQAHGGTVFLDEIGELPLSLQAKLLRVLQEKKITRLGGQQPIDVDFRLIAATNKDLNLAMTAREFREDLYFRISTFRLTIPMLRDRPADILPLAVQLTAKHAAQQGLMCAPTLSEPAAKALMAYHWPGNVRELENVIQRALVLSQGEDIQSAHLLFDDVGSESQTQLDWSASAFAAHATSAVESEDANNTSEGMQAAAPSLPAELAMPVAPIRLPDAVKSNEHKMILRAIEAAPTRAEAARMLGISPRTLRYKMAQLKMAGAA